jgi:hypothetical protein
MRDRSSAWRHSSSLAGVALATGLVTVVLLSLAVSGGAAVMARHSSPMSSGCSDSARTLRTLHVEATTEHRPGRLQVRWSRACGTAWVRFVPEDRQVSGLRFSISAIMKFKNHKDQSTASLARSATTYTTMIAVGPGACVIARISWQDGTSGSTRCVRVSPS